MVVVVLARYLLCSFFLQLLLIDISAAARQHAWKVDSGQVIWARLAVNMAST